MGCQKIVQAARSEALRARCLDCQNPNIRSRALDCVLILFFFIYSLRRTPAAAIFTLTQVTQALCRRGAFGGAGGWSHGLQ